MSKYHMRKLRKKRKQQGLCTRCGNEVKKKKRAICQSCREYLNEYNSKHRKSEKNIIIRDLKKWNITNQKLYNALIEQGTTTTKLAKMIGVTTRSVEAWIFEKVTPKKNHQQLVNKFLNIKIY